MSQLISLLNVEDVSRSIAFYARALGAAVESRWEAEGRVRWARIGFEGGKLMLNEPDGARSAGRSRRDEFADVVLYVMCDDAPARRATLVAAGLAPGALEPQAYGNTSSRCATPTATCSASRVRARPRATAGWRPEPRRSGGEPPRRRGGRGRCRSRGS